jgi:peptide/nickel transport system permease protein
MLWGGRISLEVGFVAVGIATIIGIILGSIAGYYGGWIDSVIMRAVDIMLSIPTIFLVLAVIAILEPSIINIMIVIGLTSWMEPARLIRAEFISLKEREFVIASRAIGASDGRIIMKHVLPNGLSPILVSATMGIGGAILVESALSFLGLGVQPPTPSWGSLLSSGKDNIEIAWWLSAFPGLAILITVLGYNLLGEGIRAPLDQAEGSGTSSTAYFRRVAVPIIGVVSPGNEGGHDEQKGVMIGGSTIQSSLRQSAGRRRRRGFGIDKGR